jgi:hypothetical protein
MRHVYPKTAVSMSSSTIEASSSKCNLFSTWYGWKIAHFMLNNNHSLTLMLNFVYLFTNVIMANHMISLITSSTTDPRSSKSDWLFWNAAIVSILNNVYTSLQCRCILPSDWLFCLTPNGQCLCPIWKTYLSICELFYQWAIAIKIVSVVQSRYHNFIQK